LRTRFVSDAAHAVRADRSALRLAVNRTIRRARSTWMSGVLSMVALSAASRHSIEANVGARWQGVGHAGLPVQSGS